MLKGEKIQEGMDLGADGYRKITIKKNEHGVPVVYGQAWVDVDLTNLKNWTNPDGSYKL